MSSSWFLLGPCAGSSGTRARMRQHLPKNHNLLLSYWRRSYNYLLGDLELLLATKHYSLQHLVRANVSLKVLHVPQLSDELSEPVFDNKTLAMWVNLEQLTPHLVTSWKLISPGGLLISL